ncbi:MAG TPA: arylsulfotransferase family protein [Solirubrobacteraceae bacterium]|nr:arylsulfotransferase family protein [Solirubrobacteraceae bacterium]
MQGNRHLRLAIPAIACTIAVGLVAAASVQAASYTTTGAWTFTSEPNLHPPRLRNAGPAGARGLAPGYFLIANFKNATLTAPQVGQGGPLILDSTLAPVWFHPVASNLSATNLRTQTYHGKPVLTWWQGTITNTGATTSGTNIVVDQHYKVVATLNGTGGWVLSPHEFLINGSNAWVTAYKVVGPMNLSAFGGSAQGFLLDSAVQEYSLRTGRLLYTWDIKDHVSLADSETHAPPLPTVAWDAYHVNSIQLIGSTRFLTSMRNTWAAYMVNTATNGVEWTLGGKASTFTLPATAQFAWQHDVELHGGNEISMFDDACCNITATGFGPPLGPSRGLVLALNTSAHTGTVIHEYTHGAGFNAAFLGNTQLLANGNVLVGWGSKPNFSEFSKNGQLLFDGVLPGPDVSYRAFSSTWTATPSVPPAGAARRSGGRDTVYASWDGATSVVSWRVLAGADSTHLTSVAVRARSGFETAIRLKKTYRVFTIQALDGKGRTLGTSRQFASVRSGGGAGTPKVCFYPPC